MQILALNENAIMLVMDPAQSASDTLPIALFESDATGFKPVPYVMESGEAERIAVELVAHTRDQDAIAPGAYPSLCVVMAVVPHLKTLGNAVVRLRERVQVLVRYATRVQSGLLL
jgi:hypothetical protein